jgi:hypothetical protein
MINNDWIFCFQSDGTIALQNYRGMGWDLHIYEEMGTADYNTNDYRFNTWLCEAVDEEEWAWQIGYELVSLFNGANRLLGRQFRTQTLRGVYKGNRPTQAQENLQLTGILQEAIQTVKLPPDYEDQIKADRCAWLIHAAKTEFGIYLLLKHLNLQVNWVTLYKTLETAEAVASQEGISLDVAKKRRKAFTNSANNFSIVGFESRHGYSQGEKENKTEKMRINEATEFVTDVCRQYIRQKLQLS